MRLWKRKRRKSLKRWLAERPERQRTAARIRAGFVDPYRRQRPRDPVSAELLRQGGTPEHLIGPVNEPPQPGRTLSAEEFLRGIGMEEYIEKLPKRD